MHFGIVADNDPLEHRVPISPYGVEELVAQGHKVTLEQGAGTRAHFSDEDYTVKGATIAFSAEEAWMRPDMLLRVRPPSAAEAGFMRPGQAIGCYVDLPFIDHKTREAYKQAKITLLAFEEVNDGKGRWPLLSPLSMICGRMLPQIAAHFLETHQGGRGKLLMGAPGVAPCNIAIIGAGTLGTVAAQIFQSLGTRVTILDSDHAQLERIERNFSGMITTLSAAPSNISRVCKGSDVIVLSIHHPSGVCPKVITRDHLKTMEPRALIIDASITQGGAAETSRPTDVLSPVFEVDNILHYCVTRNTSIVARTTSRAISSALVPFLFHYVDVHQGGQLDSRQDPNSGFVLVDGVFQSKYAGIDNGGNA